MTAICIAGATGWTGRAIVDGVLAADDLELRSAVARATAGEDLGTALGRERLGVQVHGDVAAALDGVDVLIDYTSHDAVLPNTLAAIAGGVGVVIGSSGLTAADFEEIDAAAREHGAGVIAAGNFSLTAAMAQAGGAARRAPPAALGGDRLRIRRQGRRPERDRARAGRAARRRSALPPAPSRPTRSPGRARRAARPSRAPRCTRCGCRASSSRPRSSSGCPTSASRSATTRAPRRRPYVAGTLLAARAVGGRTGLTRGLDAVLLEAPESTPLRVCVAMRRQLATERSKQRAGDVLAPLRRPAPT